MQSVTFVPAAQASWLFGTEAGIVRRDTRLVEPRSGESSEKVHGPLEGVGGVQAERVHAARNAARPRESGRAGSELQGVMTQGRGGTPEHPDRTVHEVP